MDHFAFEHHLTSPQGEGRLPRGGHVATAGGGSCCDTITFSVAVDAERVTDAGFVARGCGSATAAASAAVALVRGRTVLDAARVGAGEVTQELGGLSSGKLHAAQIAADALAHALGKAVAGTPALASRPRGFRSLIAMSGGVDSALAAELTRSRGEAVAVTLQLWSDPENDAERSCCSSSAVSGARALAHQMGLPHLTLDLRQEFRSGVVEPFISGYAGGETPNPCVGCNGHVRLDALLSLADRLGCSELVTGHYARITDFEHPNGPLLRSAADLTKDQSYMLAALAPRSLARMRFPLGELTKLEVRQRAQESGLSVADKPDSQDLCFLAGTDRSRFMARHGAVRPRPGLVVNQRGTVLAEHSGQHNFTVGQRRGLGARSPEPLYVLERDAARNRVIVGPHHALRVSTVSLRQVTLHRAGSRVGAAKLRYRSPPLPATLSVPLNEGRHRLAQVELTEPAYGVAPGQVACLMDGEVVIGWGTITRG